VDHPCPLEKQISPDTYPGIIPMQFEEAKENNPFPSINWNKKTLEEFLQPVREWQQHYHLSSSRILVGEFGCDRTAKGAEAYLIDLIDLFNVNQWHWAFYSFREDCLEVLGSTGKRRKPQSV
jgi:endoglucanase